MDPISQKSTSIGGPLSELAAGRRMAEVRNTVVAFLAPLSLYLVTMARSIYSLDSAEFTTAAYTGGLVRATGYPLYLLIGRGWSRLPIGDVGFRMNLLSVVCGALTIALTYRVLRRLGASGWAAFGALGLLTSSLYFWGLSLIAEVYTPHTAFMAGILLLLLQFEESPSPRRLAGTTFVFALGCGHHMATVLMAPACVWFVLKTGGWGCLRPRYLIPASVGLLAGLSVYLYLPLIYLSDPVFNYAGRYGPDGIFRAIDLTSISGLWWLVSGKAFSGQMMAYGSQDAVAQMGHMAAEIWRAFAAVGVGPGLLGLVVLWRSRRPVGGLLILIFLFHTGFYINYAVGDKDTMFLPSYLIWSLWLGVGYQWLLDWVGRERPPKYLSSPATARNLLRVVMFAAVTLSLLLNGPLVDQSGDHSTRRRAETVLNVVKPGGLLIGWWNTVPAVEYLQLVEGKGHEITVINRFLIDLADLQELVRRRQGSQKIYLDEPPGEALPGFVGVRVGPLYRLIRDPGTMDEAGQSESSAL